ncbi:MAG: hydroxyacid dehydrogenase [Defluviitaleaceae bacterium]|nr:hydroxyacid dehydrogenase [Defluviitaleaceae bacterium]
MNIAILMPDNYARKNFITPKVLQKLEGLGRVTFNDGEYEPRQIKKLLESADICVTGWGCINLSEDLLNTAKSLRLLVHTGGTVANIVSDYMYDKGIRVLSGNEIMAEGVAESTLAFIFAGLRQIPFYSNQVQNGQWKAVGTYAYGLMGKKVGLVGFGAIARYLVAMLQPFRVEIQVYDPYLDEAMFEKYGVSRAGSLDEVFTGNDIVSLHLAQRPENNNIIGKELLSKMRDGALLVNTARGSVIVDDDLADELKTGRISAVLDVFHEEPLPLDSRLRGMDNAILIPHMAGHVFERYEMAALALAEDVQRFVSGKPLLYEISREYAGKMTQ